MGSVNRKFIGPSFKFFYTTERKKLIFITFLIENLVVMMRKSRIVVHPKLGSKEINSEY